LRSDNLGSSQLSVSRKDTRSVSRYAWTWRETLPCLLIFLLSCMMSFRCYGWLSFCCYEW